MAVPGSTSSVLSEWAAVLGVSRDTAASYVEIVESSQVLVALRPFAGGRRSELTRAQKVFFVDNGVRHHLVGDLRPPEDRADAGAALENWLFSELWKAVPTGGDLNFWRSTSQAAGRSCCRRPGSSSRATSRPKAVPSIVGVASRRPRRTWQ